MHLSYAPPSLTCEEQTGRGKVDRKVFIFLFYVKYAEGKCRAIHRIYKNWHYPFSSSLSRLCQASSLPVTLWLSQWSHSAPMTASGPARTTEQSCPWNRNLKSFVSLLPWRQDSRHATWLGLTSFSHFEVSAKLFHLSRPQIFLSIKWQ